MLKEVGEDEARPPPPPSKLTGSDRIESSLWSDKILGVHKVLVDSFNFARVLNSKRRRSIRLPTYESKKVNKGNVTDLKMRRGKEGGGSLEGGREKSATKMQRIFF